MVEVLGGFVGRNYDGECRHGSGVETQLGWPIEWQLGFPSVFSHAMIRRSQRVPDFAEDSSTLFGGRIGNSNGVRFQPGVSNWTIFYSPLKESRGSAGLRVGHSYQPYFSNDKFHDFGL
jgi:hypothetical protein